MYKTGILNSEISKVLSDLGHTDEIVIGDCGLPIPDGVKKIDLALKKGTPSFIDVLKEIEKHMVIEEVVLAEEIKIHNKMILGDVEMTLSTLNPRYVSHEEFKLLNKNAKVIIRTGEATPYANIILKSGVNF